MLNRPTSPSELVFIRRLGLFEDVSPENSGAIVSCACLKYFSRHQTIFWVGDAIKHVVLLLSGCIKITQQGMRGNKAILRLTGIGDVLGTLGQWSQCKYASTAQAIRPGTALVWEAATFDGLLNRFATLQRNMVRALEERLQTMEDRFCQVSTENVGLPLSNELIRLSRRFGHGVDGSGEIRLSHTIWLN